MSTVHLYTDYNWGQVSTVHWLQLITPVHWGTTTVKTTGSGRIWVMWFNDNHFLLRKLQSVCPLSVSWCHVVANIVKVELLICTFKAYNWPQRTKYFLSRWKVDGLKPGGRDTTAGVTRPSAGCRPITAGGGWSQSDGEKSEFCSRPLELRTRHLLAAGWRHWYSHWAVTPFVLGPATTRTNHSACIKKYLKSGLGLLALLKKEFT